MEQYSLNNELKAKEAEIEKVKNENNIKLKTIIQREEISKNNKFDLMHYQNGKIMEILMKNLSI